MPNFLLICCDGLRYDRVNTRYMPGISSLSQAFFTCCLADGGTTLSSLPKILCSQAAYDPVKNLPALMKKYDYLTVLVHTSPYLSDFKAGFIKEVDVYDQVLGSTQALIRNTKRKVAKVLQIRGLRSKSQPFLPYARAPTVLAAAEKQIELLQERRSNWFMWVHLMDPHIPYMPVNFSDVTTWPRVDELRRKILKSEMIDVKDISEAIKLYDQEISELDRALNPFIRKLLKNNDVKICLTSDHGDELGAYGFFSHHVKEHGLVPQLAHIPLTFFSSDMTQYRIITHYTSSLDIAPTILGWAGIREKMGYGHSLNKRMSKPGDISILEELVGVVKAYKVGRKEVHGSVAVTIPKYAHKKLSRQPKGQKFLVTLRGQNTLIYEMLEEDPPQ